MATMLEKFNEYKKALDRKVDILKEECQRAIDAAGEEFLNNYKSLVKNASEDEFIKFIELPRGVIDDVDKIAAIMIRSMEN